VERFVAVHIGTATATEKAAWAAKDPAEIEKLQAAGMAAWGEWAEKHAERIVDISAPLGKTKRASSEGISDTSSTLTGYVVVEAESHEAGARMFEGHPHFTIFPGRSVEIMEILSL